MLKITRKRFFSAGYAWLFAVTSCYSSAGYNRTFAGYNCRFAGYVRVINFLFIHVVNALIHRITRITRNFSPHTGGG